MPTELTEQQQTAVEIRDVSIALSAGAGCGKTHVLTERFLSHLDPENADAPQPTELHQLIAITFTDAAAREMRTRIREKCRERLQAAPAEHKHYWLTLLRAIEAARVSTIHAFCSSLLRDHAVAAKLDPLFGVLEQGAADVLLSETIDDVLREKLAAQDNDTLELASEYGLARVKNQIAELLPHRHEAAFHDWLSKTPDEAVTAWHACYDGEAFRSSLREIAAKAPIAEMLRLLHAITPKKDIFIVAKANLLDLLPRLVDGSITASQVGTIREQARVQGLCTAKDWPSVDAFEKYKNACKAVRDAIDRHALQPFDESIARETARLGLALLRLTNDVVQAYEARKAAEGKLDFNDLLANARRLLTDPTHAAIRQHLSSQLSLVLVDEFQDTNPLQVEVVNALSGGVQSDRLFLVGDIKQSIYRFNGARPEVFRKLRDEVTDRGRLPLTKNFRSQPAILNFVNALFVEAFGDEYEPLRPNRSQTTEQPAVEFLWAITPEKYGNHKGAVLEARREEARWIARRLRAIVDSDDERPIIDEATGQPRPAQLGDIAILLRALSDIQVYEEALRAYELDYYLVGGRAFYAQQEIFDVLNLLRAVASPADEISLAGALRSPFFALADETLFWLFKTAGGNLNAGLLANVLPAELSLEEGAKTAAAAETLRQLRGQKDHLAIAELLSEAIARTGYDATLLAEFLGERKLANLHKLL
ncbi:MAG: UvrD-helicase domain-containing protein, partial [Planctomycetes bacterium]|nr:UvrD-helicase domain-containing protein [Planctomycetota bacterium]